MVGAGVAQGRIWDEEREWLCLLKDLCWLVVVNGMCHHSSQRTFSGFGFHNTRLCLAMILSCSVNFSQGDKCLFTSFTALTTDQINDSNQVWCDEATSLTVSYSSMALMVVLPTGMWAMYGQLRH